MSIYNEILGDIGLPTVRAVSSRRQRPSYSPEEEQSILSTLGNHALSGIAAVGNVLDIPGSMVRDVVSGANPLDQLLSPFSGENRTSGRDVLTKWGLTSPNDPNAWEAADFGGFAAELALDPTLPISLGAKALGLGGQVAKRAGLMDDLAKIAAKGKGPREARMTTTLGDLLQPRLGELPPGSGAGPAWDITRGRKAAQAAEAMGVDLADVADQPLGGLVGIGMPFGDPSATYGSVGLARKLDQWGRKAQFAKIPGTDLAPLSALNRLFNAKVGDASSQVGQRNVLPSITSARNQGRAAARGAVGDVAMDLLARGGNFANEDHSRALRKLYEGVTTAATPELAQHVDKVRSVLDPMVAEAEAWGLHGSELFDSRIKYFPRYMSRELRDPQGSRRIVSTFDPQNVGRHEYLKDLGEGTETIFQMLEDPIIKDALDNGTSINDIAQLIGSRHGNNVPAAYIDSASQSVKDRREAIARFFKSMDGDVRASGLYGNHPVQDLAARLQSGYETLEVGKEVLRQLADPTTIKEAFATSRTPGQSVKLGQVLKAVGFVPGDHNGGALKKLAELSGLKNPGEKIVESMADVPLPQDFADDLVRYVQSFKSPEAANEIIKAVDSVTNLFKGGVTAPWPAFHIRNLMSGQWQNWAAGQWSLASLREADKVMRGQSADLTSIPAIRSELAKAGLPATPENATDMLRKLAWQHDVVGKYESLGANTSGTVAAGSTLADLVGEMPGGVLQGTGSPFRPTDAFDLLLGRPTGAKSSPTAAPYLTDDQIQKLPFRQIRTNATPDESKLLSFATNEHDSFAKLSQTHAQFNEGLNRLVANHAMTPDDAKLARVIFSQSSGRSIAGVDLAYEKVIERDWIAKNHELGRVGGLAEQRRWNEGGSGIIPDRVTLSRMPDKMSVGNSSLKILLHELGHHAYWRMDDDLKSEFFRLYGADPNGVRKYVDDVIQPKNLRTRDKYLDYFSKDPAEFFSERFAHSLMERKIPEGVLGQMVEKVRGIVMELISRIKGALGFEPSLRKRLDEIIDVVGGFDRTPNGRSGWDEAVSQLPGHTSPPQSVTHETWWNLGDPKDLEDFNFWSNSKLGQQGGDNYLKRFATGVVNPDGTRRRFDGAAGHPIADDALTATTWNPLKAQVRGVGEATETTFAPLAAGQHLGHYIEGLNRLTPFLENLRKGVDPAEAAARVAQTQVDYAGRAYTKFEKGIVARMFPFYKFSKGMIPYTISRLWEAPGGKLAQTIRAQNDARGNDASTPDYVAESASIPLGANEDGSQRYITGFGLPMEDAMSFLGGGVRGGLMEAASRLNPLLKAPLEWATGESFFQKGPQGGRDLEDLDPTIGRILANVSGETKPVDLPDGLEFMVANSPLARALTTLRTATDPRKRDALGALNLATGVRVSDVSPAAQDAVIRERSAALMKELGAKSFARVYFPKDDVANMSPLEQQQALRLQLLQNVLAERAKERKAEKQRSQ